MKKILISLMVLTFFTAIISTSYIEASTVSGNINYIEEDEYLGNYEPGMKGFDIAILMDDSTDIAFEDSQEPQIRPFAIQFAPIVIAVVVQLVTKWVGKQAAKKITKHAAERASERGISEKNFAQALAYGTKYVDTKTGAKILYHSPTKTALVLDKTGETVVTCYIQKSPKAVWKKQKW